MVRIHFSEIPGTTSIKHLGEKKQASDRDTTHTHTLTHTEDMGFCMGVLSSLLFGDTFHAPLRQTREVHTGNRARIRARVPGWGTQWSATSSVSAPHPPGPRVRRIKYETITQLYASLRCNLWLTVQQQHFNGPYGSASEKENFTEPASVLTRSPQRDMGPTHWWKR